ncbi:hypothetical protein Pfo_010625 [Paulownia fortunei]|nr:hypothetical protein Pfo_010625 [Paulownia fortunei]
MATRRREIVPGKEKRGISPSHTGTTQLRGSPSYPSKTNSPAQNHDSTASQKHIPNYLKPTMSSATTDVSKQQGKKPASSDSGHKPTHSRRGSFDKTPTPTQKTRVSTNPSLRSSSSFSGKTIASPKSVPGKNLKALTKDAEKHRSLYATPVSTVKKSNTCTKQQETENSTSATKEQITGTPHENVEHPNIFSVPEPEIQPEDQESSITEAEEEQTGQVVSNNEKGTYDLLLEDQEPLNIEQTEAESDDKDAKIVIAESSTVLEHQDPLKTITEAEEEQTGQVVSNNEKGTYDLLLEDQEPLNIEQTEAESDDKDAKIVIAESEDKSYIEETSSKQQDLEEHIMNVINSSNSGENVADNPNEEAEEKEVKEVEVVVEEKEKALNKKDEAAIGSEAHESMETEVQEVVEEKKQESENAATKQQQRAQGKKDSAVSNDVIEETASKLREQRKNKVRALAGAFETVISLQETK